MFNRQQIARWTATALAIACVSPTARAQVSSVASPAPLTLEQVLELAQPRSESIAAAEAGVRRAIGDEVRARSGRYPQLSASASYDRALASEFEGLFDSSGAPPCDPFTPNPLAPLDARVTEIERAIDCGAVGSSFFGGSDSGDGVSDLPFGRKNTWRANLLLSQTIYSGGRLRAQSDIAAAGRQSAELSLTSARAQLLFDATQAYYDAALSDRLVSIAEATLGQAEATFKQVQAGFNAGTQPEFELLRARVARDNERPALIRQRANREVALLRLKQILELPANQDVRLAAALDDPALAPPAAFATRLTAVEQALRAEGPERVTNANIPMPDRVAVKEVAAQVRVREGTLSAARAERFPSASVNSTYGNVMYPPGFVPLSDIRTNWTVGAQISVPILTGGRLRGEEMVARAELEQSQLQLEQTQELAALDTRSAWAELVAAHAAWQASSGTVQQASRAYEIAEVRYGAGVSTQLELSDSRVLLQQAEANRAQAARDLQVARARIALLPELPLSTGPAGSVPQQRLQPLVTPTVPTTPQQQPLGGGQLRNAAAPQPTTPIGARP
jgi:outer membrane protein TolC